MAELWTFSGVNSWSDSAGDYVDYTWEAMKAHISQSPTRRYASRLGSTKHYDKKQSIVNLRSESILDREAREYVAGKMDQPKIRKGMFRGKQVRVLLTGPKTTTAPPRVHGLLIEVFWSPMDKIPNQELLQIDSLGSWRKFALGGGRVWPMENKEGVGSGKGHHIKGYFAKSPKLVKRVLRARTGGRRRKWVWKRTGERSPWAMDIVKTWLSDPAVDYVFVAHSQGTNIAAHVIKKGYE